MTDYRKLIDDLWGYAETGFEEYHSAETMCTFLENEGFQVTRNIAHMETAFEAVYGKSRYGLQPGQAAEPYLGY